MATETLGKHEGKLCVIHSEPAWSRPVMVSLYWPAVSNLDPESISENCGANLIHHGNGIYHADTDGPFVPTVRLIDGTSTKPIHVEEKPIPQPKGWKKCEYRNGEWVNMSAAACRARNRR